MAEASVLDATPANPAADAAAPAAPATPSWRDTLPDDLKADKSLETFKDVPSLAKSYVETKKLVGAKQGLTVPGKDATPEQRAEFYKALGVPDKPELYEVPKHPVMAHPEWNPEAQAAFLKGAHEQGYTPGQVQYAMKFYGDFIAQGLKSNETMAQEARGELRGEWGVNYDTYIGAANNGMTRIAQALKVDKADLFEATKGSDPALVARMFHWMESQFLEHGFVMGEPIADMPPEDALNQIKEIREQLKKLPEGDARHAALINRIIQLTPASRR
jgi:hypothetical protein